MLRQRAGRPVGLLALCQPTAADKPPAGPGWITRSSMTATASGRGAKTPACGSSRATATTGSRATH
jgi:hypothetical protein